ncbi:MAG: universal stress protein [Candidatus Krumholzibacteriota bacterium]|nr:universal stress protein [Candidatus Krumholzibacteriota bacterium]
MLKVKKILCPIDFSESSYKALEMACGYANHFAADLILVHVIAPVPTMMAGPEPTMAFDVSTYEDHLMKTNEEHIKKVADERVSDDIDVKPMILRGDPGDQIIRISDEEEVDLTVISSRGHSSFKEMLFGSVAERVIRHSSNPVLSIR